LYRKTLNISTQVDICAKGSGIDASAFSSADDPQVVEGPHRRAAELLFGHANPWPGQQLAGEFFVLIRKIRTYERRDCRPEW
jgi:hypothetical protein